MTTHVFPPAIIEIPLLMMVSPRWSGDVIRAFSPNPGSDRTSRTYLMKSSASDLYTTGQNRNSASAASTPAAEKERTFHLCLNST